MFRRKHLKYITITIPIEKAVTANDKNEEEITKNISYLLKFIDSARLIASLLSNFVNNLSQGIHRIKFENGQNDKNCEACGIKYKYCGCFLNIKILTMIK